jgi:hypothetical protein
MPGVGSPHSASPFCPIKRNRIEADILAPESVLESHRQIIRGSIELRRRFVQT